MRKTRAVLQNKGRVLPAELTAEIKCEGFAAFTKRRSDMGDMLPFSQPALLVAMDFPGWILT